MCKSHIMDRVDLIIRSVEVLIKNRLFHKLRSVFVRTAVSEFLCFQSKLLLIYSGFFLTP